MHLVHSDSLYKQPTLLLENTFILSCLADLKYLGTYGILAISSLFNKSKHSKK